MFAICFECEPMRTSHLWLRFDGKAYRMWSVNFYRNKWQTNGEIYIRRRVSTRQKNGINVRRPRDNGLEQRNANDLEQFPNQQNAPNNVIQRVIPSATDAASSMEIKGNGFDSMSPLSVCRSGYTIASDEWNGWFIVVYLRRGSQIEWKIIRWH